MAEEEEAGWLIYAEYVCVSVTANDVQKFTTNRILSENW